MPQTEEHLQILLYLGVGRAVVALTKADLAADLDAARALVREKLKGTPFTGAPVVPTSTVTGGFDALKGALAEAMADLPPPRDVGKPRLPVDRAFTLKGVGTVVTGTLAGGSVKRGQAMAVFPSGRAARVRTVHNHNSEVDAVGPGNRVALNLPDLQVDGAAHAGQANLVRRGDVVAPADLGVASDAADVLLERTARPAAGVQVLKDGARVRVHLGSGDVACRVKFITGEGGLAAGQHALAQLRFEAPVYAFAGDRFIVRDWPEQHTLAGGVVLDPDAPRRGFRTDARWQFLRPRVEAPADAMAYARSEIQRLGATRASKLLLKSRFSAADVAQAVSRLAAEGAAVLSGDTVACAGRWQSLVKHAAEAVDAEHRARPEELGIKLSDLRGRLEAYAALPVAEVFDALVADLCRNGFVRAGAVIRRATHRPALPPRLQAAGARIRGALAAKPFDPPSRKDLAPDATAQQALRFLVQTGEAVELGDDAVLSAEGYAKAVDAIRTFLRQRGQATVSELKPVLGVSRRIMVPLVEKLDRDGVTVRKGDYRVLRSSA